MLAMMTIMFNMVLAMTMLVRMMIMMVVWFMRARQEDRHILHIL